MDLHPDTAGAIPRVRTRASEAASETAFALLDGLWRAPVGIALLDRDLRYLQVNETLERFSGVSAERHRGRTVREVLAGFPPDTVARVEGAVRSVLETGVPPAAVELVTTLPDGGERAWRILCYPVLDASGGVRAVCEVVSDVSEDRAREVALERARSGAERAARRVAALLEMTSALSAAHDPAAVASAAVERARAVLGVDGATLRLVRGGRLALVASAGLDPGPLAEVAAIPLDALHPAAEVVRRREAMWLESPEEIAARYPEARGAFARLGMGAAAAVPLLVGGQPTGALSLLAARARTFDPEERAVVLSMAEQCAQALDRATLQASQRAAHETARRTVELLGQLQAVTSALAAARTVSDVAEVMVDQAAQALGADGAVAYLVSAGGAELELRAHRNLSPADQARFRRVPLDAPLPVCEAARSGEALWLDSPAAVRAAHPGLDVAAGWPGQVGALVVLPFGAGEEVRGALGMEFRAPRAFEPELRELLDTAVEQCAQALERARLFDSERAAHEEAQAARSTLDAIIDNAPVGIALFGRDLRFARVNALLADIDGLSAEGHLGRTLREVLPGLPADAIEETLRRVLATGGPALEVPVAGETPAAPGKLRRWTTSAFEVRGGVGVLVREVTAEHEAREFQRHVVGVVGHDLRTPLSALLIATRLLARGDDVTDRQRRLVGRIESGASRMEHIIGLLLDYTQARAEEGVPVRPRPCDLEAVCHAVAEECEAARPGRAVRCAGEGDGRGEWDPDRLGQLLANLVTNALDHGQPDSPVDLRWRGDHAEVAIEVANAGPAIPPEVLARMFEPFHRGERRRGGGMGLGLFIARAIAAAHGGRIEARSSQADGTAFTVRLPRRAPGR